jgi:hypothetical protein
MVTIRPAGADDRADLFRLASAFPNARMENPGACKLCRQAAEIRNSHLLSAGFYRLARTPNDSNAHPVVITANIAIKSSREVKAPLLCDDCEKRFNVRGEDWVLRNCLREAAFPLQETLIREQPLHVDSHANFAVFPGTAVSGVSIEHLSYFAASVFWRAGAREWGVDKGKPLRLQLGPYAEELRRFLVDEAPFPRDAVLLVAVAQKRELENFSTLPVLVGHNALFRSYWFKVPGITFRLLVGRGLPGEYRELCAIRSPERRIVVGDMVDAANVRLALQLVKRTRVHRNVRER